MGIKLKKKQTEEGASACSVPESFSINLVSIVLKTDLINAHLRWSGF